METKYTVYTTTASWHIYAYSDQDAMRRALWFCWRDGEEFVKIERYDCGKTITLRICRIDGNNNITSI